jgi:hypothetical protein
MTIDNGMMTKGTFNDVDLRTEDRFDKLDTTFTQLTLEGSHEFSDRFKVNALIGHSDSKHKNPIQTTLISISSTSTTTASTSRRPAQPDLQFRHRQPDQPVRLGSNPDPRASAVRQQQV